MPIDVPTNRPYRWPKEIGGDGWFDSGWLFCGRLWVPKLDIFGVCFLLICGWFRVHMCQVEFDSESIGGPFWNWFGNYPSLIRGWLDQERSRLIRDRFGVCVAPLQIAFIAFHFGFFLVALTGWLRWITAVWENFGQNNDAMCCDRHWLHQIYHTSIQNPCLVTFWEGWGCDNQRRSLQHRSHGTK